MAYPDLCPAQTGGLSCGDPPYLLSYVSPLLDWINSRVEAAIEKHGLTREDMRDPKLESAIDFAKGMGGNVVEFAKAVGTYGKVDRSAQYEGELDSLDGVLLRRKLQAKYDTLFAEQRRQEKVKFRHALAILVLSFFLGNATTIWTFLASLTR